MPTVTVSGKDTLTLYDRVITDLADSDVSSIDFPENLAELSVGKNQNAMYAKNEKGNIADMILRIIRGSADDKFLQGKLASLRNDFSTFELITGEFVKRLGDGDGNVTRDVYTLRGGIFTKPVAAKENVEGDTEQSVSIFTIKFAQASRGLV